MAASVLSAVVELGCARRLRLTPQELAKIEAKGGGVDDLRVHVRRATILRYDEEAAKESFEVNREVTERQLRKPKVIPIGRGTRGKIIGLGEANGMPILWVSFDLRMCDQIACALGFVQTEDERYKLAVVPERAGYKAPKVFRRREKRRLRMSLGKVEALAEANDVYLTRPKRRKVKKRRIKTIDLDFKKNQRIRERRDVDRPEGVD
ncbi:MAG: hypothetical protein KC486_33235 [Myxococcales bacterium]|nr:hypothetical protein [Myxococcales bacterium]